MQILTKAKRSYFYILVIATQAKQTLIKGYDFFHTLLTSTVFLTQIISRRQKNADAKVALSISRQQKWNSRRQSSKNCIFPNIQLNGVVNRLPPFKNLSDHTNRSLMV